MLHKYYKNLNVARELVFQDVHFALFYTAIFNAFQTVILAVMATRVSHKHWVQTEHLELDHYVEIREEFDRITNQLYPTNTFRWGCIVRNGCMSLRYPRLRQRYLKLLIQVKFHQLRIHFLEGNNLPLTLKVSDYLKKAERGVLIKLVHVSTVAWLFLTGGLTLIYFLMGMVGSVSRSTRVIGTSMAVIFCSTMIIFVLASFMVYLKMKRIFSTILYVPSYYDEDVNHI